MKTFVGFLVAVTYLFVVVTHGAPRGSISSSSAESNEKDDVVTVLVLPPGARKRLANPILKEPGTSDIDDDDTFTDLLTPEFPTFNNPFRSNLFDGLFPRIPDALTRLREQMLGFLSRMADQDFVGPWSKIPEKANITSTTKVIDGHVVTVNETTYTGVDDNYDMLVRVRIIDVKPQDDTVRRTDSGADLSPATTLAPSIARSSTTPQEEEDDRDDGTTPSRSIETVEDFDNELPKVLFIGVIPLSLAWYEKRRIVV